MAVNNIEELEKRQQSRLKKELAVNILALDMLLYAAHLYAGVICQQSWLVEAPGACLPFEHINNAGAISDYIDSVREYLDELRKDLGISIPSGSSYPPRPPKTLFDVEEECYPEDYSPDSNDNCSSEGCKPCTSL